MCQCDDGDDLYVCVCVRVCVSAHVWLYVCRTRVHHSVCLWDFARMCVCVCMRVCASASAPSVLHSQVPLILLSSHVESSFPYQASPGLHQALLAMTEATTIGLRYRCLALRFGGETCHGRRLTTTHTHTQNRLQPPKQNIFQNASSWLMKQWQEEKYNFWNRKIHHHLLKFRGS